MSIDSSYKKIIEGLIFLTDTPLNLSQLSEILNIGEPEIESLLFDLLDEYRPGKRGYYLRQIAGGYQFFADEEVKPFLEKWTCRGSSKLSSASLEVLAVIAYRQPVTRGEIEEVRGVNCDAPIRSLLERGLIEERGRKEAPGRPILFATTIDFLITFGLNTLADLPVPEEIKPSFERQATESENEQEE